MGNKEKWMWVPILAFGVGGATPLLFVDFVDGSWQDKIWVGMLPTTAVFIYSLFKRVGRRMPVISEWAQDSLFGATLLVFVGTFVASGAGVLFALLPVPHWLHFAFGICLALAALVLLVS